MFELKIPAEKPLKKNKKWDGFSAFLVIAAAGIAVWAGVLGWKKHTLNEDIFELQNSISRVEVQIQAIKQSDNVDDKQRAAEILARAEKYRVKWSQLINAILRHETSDVRFFQFGSTPDGNVTVTGNATSISALTQFLEKIKTAPDVAHAFIPTLSTEESGNRIHFQIRFDIEVPQ